MNVARLVGIPRTPLAALPTPLVRAQGLEKALALGPVYIKRDDLTGFGIAGNKARALEFLLGAAAAERADVLVAAGGPGSNFCAAAAMAASTVGLDCDLLIAGPAPAGPSVNLELARISGARLCFQPATSREDLDDAVRVHADALRAQGRRPYAVPRGGATAVGAIGYALAAREIAGQCAAAGIRPQVMVLATGSGCTQAGLVAGQVGLGNPWRVIAASVSRPPEPMREQVLSLSRACADRLGHPPPALSDVDLRDMRGPGFGVPSEQDRMSARIALRHEGILLDHAYGAKAMTLLRSVLAGGATPAVFLHTGGLACALSALTEGAGR